MTRVQRTVHARLWVVLGPLVLAGVLVAVWNRAAVTQAAKPQATPVETAGGAR